MNVSFLDAPPPPPVACDYFLTLLRKSRYKLAEVVCSSAAQNVVPRSAGCMQSTQLLAASLLQDAELIPM